MWAIKIPYQGKKVPKITQVTAQANIAMDQNVKLIKENKDKHLIMSKFE